MRTDYTSTRKAGEGYYTLKSNNADEAGADSGWEETKIPEYKSPA